MKMIPVVVVDTKMRHLTQKESLIPVLVLVGISLSMTACQAQIDTPYPDEISPTLSQIATIPISSPEVKTIAATSSPDRGTVVTQMSTSTPFPEIPEFKSLEVAQSPILLSEEEDCRLPCFRGLQVEISNLDDVKRMYEDVFALHGQVEFAHLLMPGLPNTMESFPDIWNIEFHVEADSLNHSGLFTIDTVFDSSNILQGISISQLPQGQYSIGTPQNIVMKLGSPDYIDVLFDQKGSGSTGVFSIKLIYFTGMSLTFTYEQAPIGDSGSNSSPVYPPICLNSDPIFNVTYLVAPFDSIELAEPTITQAEWIWIGQDGDLWQSVEQQLDMSIAEFAVWIAGTDPCFDIDFSSIR